MITGTPALISQKSVSPVIRPRRTLWDYTSMAKSNRKL